MHSLGEARVPGTDVLVFWVLPLAYPAVTPLTPGMREKYSSTPQKHPPAKYTSLSPDSAAVFFSISASLLLPLPGEDVSSAAMASVDASRKTTDRRNNTVFFMASSFAGDPEHPVPVWCFTFREGIPAVHGRAPEKIRVLSFRPRGILTACRALYGGRAFVQEWYSHTGGRR